LLKKINKHLIERHAAFRIEPLTDSDKSDFSFDHKNFYDLIISHIIIFILNFFKSQTKSKLHLIKNKLFIENIELGENRSVAVVDSCAKFLKTVKHLMDESFSAEYIDLFRKVACFIGYSLEKVFNHEAKAHSDLKKHLGNFTFSIFSELIEDREAQSATNDVL